MSTTKRRKSAKETRVLVASIITAAAIVAGSTFAWFSSSDEVTNRLSANADYGVTIAEDFTPPENWLPGQTVEKNVGVVNTGNVDAFVRTWLEGEMDLIAQTKSDTTASAFAQSAPTLNDAVTDLQLRSVGLNYKKENIYFKELDQFNRHNNPVLVGNAAVHGDAYTEVDAVQAGGVLVSAPENAKFSFVPNQAINIHNDQNEDFEIPANATVNVTIDSSATVNIAVTAPEAGSDSNDYAVTAKSIAAFGKIDTDRFTPKTTGTYIFRRNVALATPGSSAGGQTAVDDFEFTGYVYIDGLSVDAEPGAPVDTTQYVDPECTIPVEEVITTGFFVETEGVISYYADQAALDAAGVTDGISTLGRGRMLYRAGNTYYKTPYTKTPVPSENGGAYFALEYDDTHEQRSDYVLPKNTYTYTKTPDGLYTFTDTGIKVFTAEEKNLANKDLKWSFTEASGDGETAVPAQFHVFYDFDETDDSTVTEPDQRDIVIDIDLANLGEESENWTRMSADGKTDTFYYNNDLEAGATTAKLVDAVTLNKKVTQYAFLAFDFDLNVFMDSVQVYVDKDGNEGFESVKATFAEADAESTIVSANASATVGNPEIETITWEAATATTGGEGNGQGNGQVGP